MEDLKYRQEQRGTGFYSLCGSCNSYLGRNYVPAFRDFYIAETSQILRQPCDPRHTGVCIETDKLEPIAFIKQVISNFCSINPPGSMSDCKDFLLDRKSNALPNRYRLHMRIISNLQSSRVYAGWSVAFEGTLEAEYSVMVSAITIPPFGFTLYDMTRSSAVPLRAGDITDLALAPYGRSPHIVLRLPVIHDHAVLRSLS
jgi:hypothetical protein